MRSTQINVSFRGCVFGCLDNTSSPSVTTQVMWVVHYSALLWSGFIGFSRVPFDRFPGCWGSCGNSSTLQKLMS